MPRVLSACRKRLKGRHAFEERLLFCSHRNALAPSTRGDVSLRYGAGAHMQHNRWPECRMALGAGTIAQSHRVRNHCAERARSA